MNKIDNKLFFLASPGDVKRERHIVEDVVNEINETIAKDRGVLLNLKTWEKNTFPGYGKDVQALINEQITEMKNISLFIGIMWNRIGTPTPRSESGTIEEFERAAEAFINSGRPDIWFYFREQHKDPKNKQQKQVLAFKERIQKKGKTCDYKNSTDFRKLLRTNLTMWLMKEIFPDHNTNEESSDEKNEISSKKMNIYNNLPIKMYQKYIGRSSDLNTLLSYLRDPFHNSMIMITGLGGIGKTAIAREAAEVCFKEELFRNYIWVSFKKEHYEDGRIKKAKQQRKNIGTINGIFSEILNQCKLIEATTKDFTGKKVVLRNYLNNNKVLIVLDNFETISDCVSIIDELLGMFSKSKLIITSRHKINSDNLCLMDLLKFTQPDGKSFLHEEGVRRGVKVVVDATEKDLEQIYTVTGGAPLAMKLVVGQLINLPMKVVLSDLRGVKLNRQDNAFYCYVFRNSWNLLDINAQKALVDLQDFTPSIGGTVKLIRKLSDLDNRAFWSSMDKLISLSLVDKSGPVGKERYSLHPLTQYFIKSEITKEWSST